MKKGLRLGVDIGGTLVKLAVVDERGLVLKRAQTDALKNPKSLVEAVHEEISDWGEKNFLGTGVAVAGDVDPVRGVVRFSTNLGWTNVPLVDLFRRCGFPKPFHFENDATAAAWGANHLECGGRARNLVVVTLGTGVGAGLIFDGKIYRGATGTAGELGHTPVGGEGVACLCGSRDCLEAYMGGAALMTWATNAYTQKRRSKIPVSPKELALAARRGDAVAKEAWIRGGRALGTALASLLNLLNPDTILLAGGLAKSADLFLPTARKVMMERAFHTPARVVRVRVAKNSEDLGVVGAALLVE